MSIKEYVTDPESWEIQSSGRDLWLTPVESPGGAVLDSNGRWTALSDLRLKKNISELDSVLDRVNQLRPVTYRFTNQLDWAPLNLGFIAQEVEPLFPEVVSEIGGFKGIAYSSLVPVALAAIQELDSNTKALAESLTRENRALKLRLELVEARLNAIEQRRSAAGTMGQVLHAD
ncbi:MAG TPA: tail fiber domain-containing protein [Verrucomicrobiota bacterium]|nr:hypothetical protein [Verrucomicrobiales bacterium]HRI12031.1 tail fiber domain-containing protein [Verrucomicrobiota bacterium]